MVFELLEINLLITYGLAVATAASVDNNFDILDQFSPHGIANDGALARDAEDLLEALYTYNVRIVGKQSESFKKISFICNNVAVKRRLHELVEVDLAVLALIDGAEDL